MPVDLLDGTGRGVVAGFASDDLNFNVVEWPANDGVGEHSNDLLDVLLVGLAGSMSVTVGAGVVTVSSGQALLIPRGAARAITAGPDGVRYLSVHRRRAPLTLERNDMG